MTANPKPQSILQGQYWGRLTMDQCSARADLPGEPSGVNSSGMSGQASAVTSSSDTITPAPSRDAIEPGAVDPGLTWCANSLRLADANGRVDHPPQVTFITASAPSSETL
ncbi:unnamed protein product [Clonostachys byssicola]|uniref:Uncharacterized protein n=1 Tax=Clonostachys byssicola TaxID=160290 RepID=A0A9N9UWZ1_9HYPO|nr:unnamed protein product [Clonostachys byssicola]